MPKTKLDRVLEILESQIQQGYLGEEAMQQASVDSVQPQQTNTDVQSEVTWQQPTIEAASQTEVQDLQNLQQQEMPADWNSQQDWSDDFTREFQELANMFWDNQQQVQEQTVPVEEPEEAKESESKNFKKLYEQELERRVALEGEARQAAAETQYLRTMLEKEGDKYYSNIDKQKELEAELRIARSSQMPEPIAPLWQSYLLRKETNTPAHKWRAVKDALSLVESMTGVSAEDYYANILRTESPDIPEVKEKSSVTNTVQNINGQPKTKSGLFTL